MNFQLRTAGTGGEPAPTAIHASIPLSARRCAGRMRVAWLVALLELFTACGVQAPPEPPRVEIPQQVKDLRAVQVGRTLSITFTLPTLATDGELLNKPVQVDVYRTISPAGQQRQEPDTGAEPWLTISPRDLPVYTRGGKFDYRLDLSPEEFRQRQGSTFTFAVIALTRGFRGHPRKSKPSNAARATLLDVTGPITNLEAKATQDALVLTWDKPALTLTGVPPSGLSTYRVYQSVTGKPDSFKLLGPSASSHFEDNDFHFGSQYFFRVSAVTTIGGETAESEPSAPVSITPRDVFPPPVPTGLTAVNAAGAVDLLWNASSGSDFAGYNVYRSAAGGTFVRINKQLVPTAIFHDASVESGRDYEYDVTAVDHSGNESEKSSPARITTPSPGAQ